MKLPLSWLKEFLDLPVSPQEISETLTMLGMEVEKISENRPSFKGVVVGKVLEANRHPNADRLQVAQVTDGEKIYQVVCGASNCRAGIQVALARVGAELTDKQGKKFPIKKSRIRSVDSEGMLCSAEELDFEGSSEGILELDSGLELGKSLEEYWSDTVFDLALTPNLGHCASILGIARELRAIYQNPLKLPSFSVQETGTQKATVSIPDPAICPAYTCRIITGIHNLTSPEWLKRRLSCAGLQPVNLIVDVANYVMLELGQPFHIVDLDKLKEKHLVVSSSNRELSIQTLDGKLRQIPLGTLMVMDNQTPLSIAGIIGSEATAVTENTKNILIEAAVFSPKSIRKTSKSLEIKTEASQRFDKGVDSSNLTKALNRVCDLIFKIGGGIVHPLVEIRSHPLIPLVLNCRIKRVQEILGLPLSADEIISCFERLEMPVATQDQTLSVTVPFYRNDIRSEIDLIEEVARIYGYLNIPYQSPKYSTSSLPHNPLYLLEKKARNLLLQAGLQECITCDLISPSSCKKSLEKGSEDQGLLRVLHPRSIDQSVLRPSLLPGLLDVVKFNLNHQMTCLHLFEIGRVHFKTPLANSSSIQEPTCIGIILTGENNPYYYNPKPLEVDFFDLKGIIEELLKRLRLPSYDFEHSSLQTLHPGRQAKIKIVQETIGVFGELHPQLLQQWDITTKVYFAELNLTDLLTLKKTPIAYAPFSQFPGSERDWTITLPSSLPFSQLYKAIEATKSQFLHSFYLLDLYQSDELGRDKKNVTLRFIYKNPRQTLSLEAVELEHQRVINSVSQKLQDCL